MLTYNEIINEMISNAWYSVLEFHIHLSGICGEGGIKDNLERAVVKLRDLSGLEANASKVEIKNAIKQFDKQLHAEKQALTHNVPYKALSGFANKTGEKISLLLLQEVESLRFCRHCRSWNEEVYRVES